MTAACFAVVMGAAVSCRAGWPVHGGPGKSVDGNAYASFNISPDGNEIVFAGAGNGGKDLYLLNLATRRVSCVANTPEYENYPAFSPDGKWIVYEAAASLEKPLHLYLRSLDGKHIEQITSGTNTVDSYPSFSRDGSKIVFGRTQTYYDRYGGSDAWTVNRDGSDLRRITHDDEDVVERPKFSPDGKFILYEQVTTLRVGEFVKAYVAKVDSTGKGRSRVVLPFQKFTGAACFLPGRERVVFSSNDGNGLVDLYVGDLRGGTPRALHTYVNGSGGIDAAVDRKGEWVYYLQGDANLWRVKVDGSRKEMLADGTLFSDPMHWKPGRPD